MGLPQLVALGTMTNLEIVEAEMGVRRIDRQPLQRPGTVTTEAGIKLSNVGGGSSTKRSQTHQLPGVANTKKMSPTFTPWAKPCRHWERGGCWRGISCFLAHTGFPSVTDNRCHTCRSEYHETRGCTAPGGYADPNAKTVRYSCRKRKTRQHANKK